MVLNSDDAVYDGFSRLSGGGVHVAMAEKSPNGNQDMDHTLYLYLPSRSAIANAAAPTIAAMTTSSMATRFHSRVERSMRCRREFDAISSDAFVWDKGTI